MPELGFVEDGLGERILALVHVERLVEASIDFDFDSRQLAGEVLDACFAFLRTVERALEKPVLLKHEGVDAWALAKYDPEVDDIVAEDRRPG